MELRLRSRLRVESPTAEMAAQRIFPGIQVPIGSSLPNLAAPHLARLLLRPTPLLSFKLAPKERLSLISRHFNSHAHVPLNTPFSIERQSSPSDDIEWEPLNKKPQEIKQLTQKRTFGTQTEAPPAEEKKEESKEEAQKPANMSSQAPHPALLIPGPIEFDDAVLQSMSHYSEPHTGMPFVNTFSEVLTMLRKVFQTSSPDSQPFVISGSGTLGWDQVAVNLVEPGDDVLVLHTGYFADSFADCFETYGVHATQLKAPIGDRPQHDEIEKALKEKDYKLISITHTDTSTGVLSEIESVSKLVRRVSPNTLIVVDGVCSVGCEDLQFDAWGVDCAITASQKALGCPAGLSIVMASGRAIQRFQARKTRPASYFASWKNWMPVMQNYEAKKPSYFATPSPQLIHALHTALTQLLSLPLAERFRIHRETSQRVKQTIADMGLKQLASKPENQANGMTAIYLPEGLTPPEILPTLLKKGVIFAGGLHKEIATRYLRFGHMGVSVMDPKRDDIDRALKALREGLQEVQKA
ncbi:PLP-dependent transferase [Hortaea werneckii]|nr:PLP-dependent transferase [Hortaea werneckii]KAI6812510.1 PLP-dependent transferase [Hortaea werneckii]KAI6900542.1 PLP-dependent transferase [Hortaea werneckii]KAI6928614.1 PLP-dependent transferase [Hortaea werneckii]KAI6961059.1 PLP-dependent transferase [Hortaea werneckii]